MANTFKNYTSAAVGTSDVAVYTVPGATTATVIGFSVTNVTAAAITISAKLNTTYIIKDAPIPVGSTIVLVGGDQKMVGEAADVFYVSASVASGADVIVSALELS